MVRVGWNHNILFSVWSPALPPSKLIEKQITKSLNSGKTAYAQPDFKQINCTAFPGEKLNFSGRSNSEYCQHMEPSHISALQLLEVKVHLRPHLLLLLLWFKDYASEELERFLIQNDF